MRQISTTAEGVAVMIRETIEASDQHTFTGLVDATGIPRATFYRKIDGNGDFTLGELVRIADYLGTTPGALITQAEAVAS